MINSQSMKFDSFDFNHVVTEDELEFQFPYRLKDIKDSIDKEMPSTKDYSKVGALITEIICTHTGVCALC